jgi:RNA methyltransferase, TrmH family
MFEKITSFQNPRLKLIKKLRDKRGREQEQRFVVDDGRDLERALAQGYTVDFALYCPALSHSHSVEQLDAYKVYEVSREVMEKTGYRENPSALLAVMHSKPARNLSELENMDGLPVLALVNLQKPGNIGALIRSADAAGFKIVLLIDTALDLYNPNIIRSSTGACFLNNIYALTTEQALEFFKDQRYQVVAAHLDGHHSLYDVVLDERCAVVLGTEDTGLSEVWKERADTLVKIPMVGKLSDSLNVSVSGAIFMYEALRQRLSRSV